MSKFSISATMVRTTFSRDNRPWPSFVAIIVISVAVEIILRSRRNCPERKRRAAPSICSACNVNLTDDRQAARCQSRYLARLDVPPASMMMRCEILLSLEWNCWVFVFPCRKVVRRLDSKATINSRVCALYFGEIFHWPPIVATSNFSLQDHALLGAHSEAGFGQSRRK